MFTKVNEQIEVFANFTKKGAEPVCFSWRNSDYNITSINFIHKSKNGSKNLIHYAVNANNDTYKIYFDTESITWILDEIYLENDFGNTVSLNDTYL